LMWKQYFCKDAVSSWHLLFFSTWGATRTTATSIPFEYICFWFQPSFGSAIQVLVSIQPPEHPRRLRIEILLWVGKKKSARISLKVWKKVPQNVFPETSRGSNSTLMNNSKRHSQIRFRCFFFFYLDDSTHLFFEGVSGEEMDRGESCFVLKREKTLGQYIKIIFHFFFMNLSCLGLQSE